MNNQKKQNNKKSKKGIIIAIVVILFLIITFSDEDETSKVNKTTVTSLENKTSNKKEVKKEVVKKKKDNVKTYSSGTYKVGDDIEAGEYIVEANSLANYGYVEVSKDSSGKITSIISNDNFSTQIYVTVKDGQYFKITGTAKKSSDVKPFKAKNGIYSDGMYLVGKDIEAGEYKLTVNEDSVTETAYVEVAKDSLGTLESIIANDNFRGNTYQTLKNGQYVTITGATMRKQ